MKKSNSQEKYRIPLKQQKNKPILLFHRLLVRDADVLQGHGRIARQKANPVACAYQITTNLL